MSEGKTAPAQGHAAGVGAEAEKAEFPDVKDLRRRLRGRIQARGRGKDAGAAGAEARVRASRILQYAHRRVEERRARIDGLTGLYNKADFEARLTVGVAEAQRRGKPVSLLYIDGDRFKNVNDRFGHPVGDSTLKLLAETLSHSVRRTDSVFRNGGEEFAIILPQTNARDAAAVAEKVRAAVGRARFLFGEVDVDKAQREATGHKEGFTVSVGATTYNSPAEYAPGGPSAADAAESLKASADAALYAAKKSRNAVEFRGLGVKAGD